MSENIIKIDTGVVTKTFLTTDGKECEFAFNPLDMGLSRRLFSAFEKLDKMNEGYKDEVQKNADKKEIFDIGQKVDLEMREIINGEVFGFDICTPLFGELNLYALANGFPIWANLLLRWWTKWILRMPGSRSLPTRALASTPRSTTNEIQPAKIRGAGREAIRYSV